MPRTSNRAAVHRKLDAAAHHDARLVELQIDFVDARDEMIIGRVGGLWDRIEERYVGDAEHSRVVRLHPGQLDAADWFLNEWLRKHYEGAEDEDDVILAMLGHGGRRGGKSYLFTALQIGYGVAVSGAILWQICPSRVDEKGVELRGYLQGLMPRDWYDFLGAPHWQFTLVNGSYLRQLSGFTPANAKQGTVDIAFLNEAQQIKKQTFTNAAAAIADHGGLCLVACNPPDDGDVGTWVGDVVSRTKAGLMTSARCFHFDPLLNPHIEPKILAAMAEHMSAHEFDIQVRGMFLGPSDSVLHAWNRDENERPPPQIGGECTNLFTRFHEGEEFDYVVGVDIQKYPWMVAVIGKVYNNPAHHADMREALLWIVGEVFVARGDEVDLADGLKKWGCDPERTLLIADASGKWQQAERKDVFQRDEYKGRGSYDMFEGEGFRHIVRPDRDMKGNPEVVERVRAANARISNARRECRVFADPRTAPRTIETIGGWRRSKHGHPDRTGQHAHAGDALTYLIWRFWPRRRDADEDENAGVIALPRYQGKARTKGY